MTSPVSVDEQGRETRYEVSLFVGPCSPKAVEALAEAIMGLPEFTSVYGGAVGMKPYTDEDADLAREVVYLREALRDDSETLREACNAAAWEQDHGGCDCRACTVLMDAALEAVARAALSSVPETTRETD